MHAHYWLCLSSIVYKDPGVNLWSCVSIEQYRRFHQAIPSLHVDMIEILLFTAAVRTCTHVLALWTKQCFWAARSVALFCMAYWVGKRGQFQLQGLDVYVYCTYMYVPQRTTHTCTSVVINATTSILCNNIQHMLLFSARFNKIQPIWPCCCVQHSWLGLKQTIHIT